MGSLLFLVVAVVAVLGGIAIVGFFFGVFKLEKLEEPAPEKPAGKAPVEGFDDLDFPDDMEDLDDLDGYKPYGGDDEDDEDWESEYASLLDEFGDEDDDGDEPGSTAPKKPARKKTEKNKVSLDYFAEEEAPQSGPVPPPSSDYVEQVEIEFDKLVSFKVGRGHMLDCMQVLREAQEGDRDYAVAYFDFDRFRFINSLKGVSIGDYVLSRTSQEMVDIFPEGSLFTRLSADHFVVLFPIVDEGILEDYAEQLRRLSERIRDSIGSKSGLRVCMGVALTAGAGGYNMSVLVEKANVARHCLKISRSDAHAVYDSSMLQSYLYGEQAMEDYSENQYGDEFVLYYYPLFDLKKGRIVGCESLARWACVDDFHKDEPPNSESGRLPTNNTKLIYHTCRWMGRWRKAGKEVLLGILNLPITDLFKEDIDHYLAKCIAAFQLEPKTLAVNVEMGTLLVDKDLAAQQLKKIRDIGVRVVLSGLDRSFSSISVLAGLPLDYIRFHRSCVQDVIENSEQQERVKALITEAGAHNLRTIFDGVDSQEQADLLRRAGAHMAQGFYAGKATVPDEFVHDLQEVARDSARGYNSTVILDEAALARGELRYS